MCFTTAVPEGSLMVGSKTGMAYADSTKLLLAVNNNCIGSRRQFSDNSASTTRSCGIELALTLPVCQLLPVARVQAETRPIVTSSAATPSARGSAWVPLLVKILALQA
jgi:hypothetical protein